MARTLKQKWVNIQQIIARSGIVGTDSHCELAEVWYQIDLHLCWFFILKNSIKMLSLLFLQ
jgi:hypothetical protein